MNTMSKIPEMAQVAEHAYCLLDGYDPTLMDSHELGHWESVPADHRRRASHWVVLDGIGEDRTDGKIVLYDLLKEVNKTHYELMQPIAGDVYINKEHLEIRKMDGSDDFYLLWRDVCITWYQYVGRCMCISRMLTDEEIVQFSDELKKELEEHERLSGK